MKKPRALNVNIIYNRSNTFGLAKDAQVLEELLRLQSSNGAAIGQIHHVDPREPPRSADVNFHLEVPIYGACAWAGINILLENPEHYVAAYDKYLHAFDAVLRRTGDVAEGRRQVRWCLPAEEIRELADAAAKRTERQKELGFLSLIGGSTNKGDAVAALLPYWIKGSPKLRIYTSRSDVADRLRPLIASEAPVEITLKDLAPAEALRLQKLYSGHLLASRAEGFGYAAAEADAGGAFMLLSDIPAYSIYKDRKGTAFIGDGVSATADLQSAFQKFGSWDSAGGSASAATAAAPALAAADLADVLRSISYQPPAGNIHLPPILQPADCPPITVVTLTYNRRKFIDLACLNLLLTDYPRDKIEWLVVEDSDDQAAAASDKIIGFAGKNPDIKVSYLPLEKKTSIGEKRNKAVEKAMHDIILFMDDDDVYPETSFRRRVAWLVNGSPFIRAGAGVKPRCVVSTMLAMYDLRTGQSAVNVPPLGIPLGQRVSEATLTFRKDFWAERPFPDVNMAEGEGWLDGRESAVLEIPPQQIIVALSHGANISSRVIPVDARVGCFWGWDEHMIRFLHGLIGVVVEAEGGSGKTN